MKLQILFLLLIFSIGLISNSVYADHPDGTAMEVTFDKDNYKVGETVYMESQLVTPWETTPGAIATQVYLRTNLLSTLDGWKRTNDISDSGVAFLNFTLLLDGTYEDRELTVETYFITFDPATYHYGPTYTLTLNSYCTE